MDKLIEVQGKLFSANVSHTAGKGYELMVFPANDKGHVLITCYKKAWLIASQRKNKAKEAMAIQLSKDVIENVCKALMSEPQAIKFWEAN